MRKTIAFNRIRLCDGRVELSWYKSASEFEKDSLDASPIRFRIWRREAEDFTFGKDYAEFFSDETIDDAEVIAEVDLVPSNCRKFIWTDSSVVINTTYVYFVEPEGQPTVGPLPVRVRDPETIWSYEKLQVRMQEAKDAAPDIIQLSVCGQTREGREIPVLHAGNKDCFVALVGLIHAGEAGSELIIPMVQDLAIRRPDLLKKVGVMAVPGVNLDARQKLAEGVPWYLRTTTSGVDLNRNFPVNWDKIALNYGLDTSDPDGMTFRGRSPASEPETQAIINLFDSQTPKIVFSYHCLMSICSLPALGPSLAIINRDKRYEASCRDIINLFGKGMFPELELNPDWLAFGTTDGSFSTWCYDHLSLPAFDLEGGFCCDDLSLSKSDRTTREQLTEYQVRHIKALETLLDNWVKIS